MSGFVRSCKSTRKIAKPFADSHNFEKPLLNVCVCSQSSKTRNNRDCLEINTSKIRCLVNETDDLTYSQQVQGLGTALKILFSGHEFDDGKFEKSRHFQLRRSEIVSLFNGFGR